jgi:glycosyltransferase involved in cell wall biosynthesis
LVVTEAMAMERPVVGYNSGALPEIVTDGVEGLLTPPKDIDALANALIALLNDPVRRERMGKAGRKRVLEQFRPRRQADEVAEIYRRIAAGQPDRMHASVANASGLQSQEFSKGNAGSA